jgi:Fe-S-cluster containining protein
MVKICKSCGGRCCVGIIEVQSADELFKDGLLTVSSLAGDGSRVMKTNETGRCVALQDGRCSIYDRRPQICKDFKTGSECCSSFVSGKIAVHVCEPCKLERKGDRK